jgi:hypothetical protein
MIDKFKRKTKSIYGFIHVAMINHWRDILDNQIAKLKSSRLFDITKRILICGVGEGSICISHPKISVIHISTDLRSYEYPTLHLLYNYCVKYQDSLVWYIHSKGTSYSDKRHEWWRLEMEHYIIEKHNSCMDLLENYNTCGCMLSGPKDGLKDTFYAGNFWWARADYIKTLPPIQALDNRWYAEVWISKGLNWKPVDIGKLNG